MDSFEIEQGEFVAFRDQPKLAFEEISYTLTELLDSHLLPVVAQYDSTKHPLPFHEFNFDLSQPLLLYKKRHIQKVAARSLHIEDETYKEVGETLLIPEDYKGWFAVLQRITGNTKADDSVPHFQSVEEIANSNTDRFLIGGTKKISGLQLLERSDSELKHEQRHFHPGDILTREKIYYGETRKRTRLFRKPKYITEKFLMCRDEADREILLPFEQTGIFYQISHRVGKPNRNVMQMSDIVARKLTPRIIKLVFGRFPLTPCSFTGLMKADSSRIETSIIASTLINKKNILMEIPVTSAIYFRVAILNNELRQNVCYRNAMSLCAERAITYMRNIKVCYNFTMEKDSEEDNCFIQSNIDRMNSNLDYLQSSGDILNYINNNNNNNVDEDGDQMFKSFQGLDRSYPGNPIESTVASRDSDTRRGNSVDIPDEVTTVRPGRAMSTGRMSFCLGNSYLTVPLLQHGLLRAQNSGNNNTSKGMIYTTRRGSKLSFNGMFFEEDDDDDESEKDSTTEEEVAIPAPLFCTNISSYVNANLPPTNGATSEHPDYIPASGSRRPNTQPPETAPPPLPRSSSTSGVSSGSLSSVSEETITQRESSDSFEYAVPKIQDANTILSDLSEAARFSNGSSPTENDKPHFRRPSTFTFSEGCLGPNRKEKKLHLTAVEDTNEQPVEDSSPIYENIQKLMELVAKLENKERESAEVPCDSLVVSEQEGDGKLYGDKSEGNESTVPNEEVVNDLENSDETSARKEEEIAYSEVEKCDGVNEVRQDINSSLIVIPQSNGRQEAEVNEIPVRRNAHELDTKNVVDSKVKPEVRRNDVVNLDSGVTIFEEEGQTFDKESSEKECECFAENSVNKVGIPQAEAADKTVVGELIKETVQMNELDNEQSESDGVESTTVNVKNGGDELENATNNNERLTNVALWKSAIEKVKLSSCTTRSKIREPEKPLYCLDVEEIAKELAAIGIKEATIEHIKTLGVDGAKLSEVLDGEVTIRDCLVGVNLVDQQKISMFLRGWRPNAE